jgi:hypothetical protein
MSSDNSSEGHPIDFSKTEELKLIADELLTKRNWKKASKELLGGGIEYATGQDHMVKILKRLLELELPFDELKKQLTGFVNERADFVEYAYEHAP